MVGLPGELLSGLNTQCWILSVPDWGGAGATGGSRRATCIRKQGIRRRRNDRPGRTSAAWPGALRALNVGAWKPYAGIRQVSLLC
jgi:hypothetical protein